MTEVAGAHVIQKTDDVIHVRSPDFNGKVRKWRCKYCGETGAHPDDPGSTRLSWERPCGEFEPYESEVAPMREEGEV